ncbi:hypothetical protein CFBP5507_07885 [Agrobacterium salinitolerans]|uniref:Uncharacterized protein n=1 Tax=Agrobacterium salinitolerans TaxID=1183413 RepID=A0A9X9K6Z1_9HYPH|nr:hypothetical protein [Agrobacterium salinitolerans]UYZ06182.1 hypothetical protein CFBP5507_07885 [Agrobacterium salinitolerans]
MSKRKGQNNGSTTRNQTSPAASGNAPEIDAAGAPPSADGAALDATSLVDGPNGVDGAADGKGLTDAQAASTATTEAVQQPEGFGLGDAAALSGGGEGSASAGGVEAAGGSDADGDGADGDHAGGYSDDGIGRAAAGSTATDNSGDGRKLGDDGHGNGDGGLPPGAGSGDDSDGSQDKAGSPGSEISPDLKAALELAGCDTAENLIDMARIGSNVMEAIDDVRKLEGPFKDWAPMDDPAEIVHDLYNALEHAREKAATPALDPEVDCCPICDVPFKADDVCASDIEEGTCHAECLAGSPVVDLNTGEPKSGPVDTFLYSDWIASDTSSKTGDRPWWLTAPNFSKDIHPREISHSFAYDVFRGVHGSVETAGVVINGGSPAGEPSISFEAVSELVELVRRIGPRATPDVLAQHLVITKHRQSPELRKAEELALKAFAAILIDLDDYAAAEKKRLEELAAEKPTPRPVPIDETNMELVDGPMATH